MILRFLWEKLPSMKTIDRRLLALFFYGLFIAFTLVRYLDHLMLSQIMDNPIRSPRVDPMVWTSHLVELPELIRDLQLSLPLDLVITLLPILIIYRAYHSKKVNALVAIHTILFAIYVLVIYCFPTLSIRKYLGLLLLPIAFIFVNHSRFYNYLELMRYYVCFVFTSAALWKILRGAAFDGHHMQLSLKAQHIDNFINWPDHFITQLLSTFIHNPQFNALVFFLAILLQLIFILGFLTKKHDRILGVLLIIFILADFLVMRIEYWEYLVFLPLFFRSFFSKRI